MRDYDVVIVGAGILGLAHARAARERGLRVLVVERTGRPLGASIRNFGMVWVIGQPPGRLLERALRSRETWFRVAEQAGFWISPCGSLHLAYHEDEAQVIREFVEKPGAGYRCSVLSPAEVAQRCPAARQEGLILALGSETEAAVDPRQAITSLAAWLASQGVEFRWSQPVVGVESGLVRTSSGETIHARSVFICSGDELRALFPDVLARAGLTRCKLQMMRTAAQPGWTLGTHIAGGLTLRHYKAFADCPTLPALRDRIARENPEYDELGIHVLVSQNQRGELLMGDTHEYGDDVDPFDSARAEQLIVRYLRRMIHAPSLDVESRWNGSYAKFPDGRTELIESPMPGVWVVNGVGGAGMTLSFGLADDMLERVVGAR
ncbi:MAG: TIGR03364 family FAD-dependent oxidoreductase [Planctomycetota bacterium]|nr:TIGR03364 family FAD-dependent oxidoreductase [Planctomycetota bacterium]